MKKKYITILIILGIIIFSIIIIFSEPNTETPEDIVKCIGQNSKLYVQLGCHACETQEKIFGENYKYLDVVDCFYERDKCSEIKYTPTWIIKGEEYVGLQSIEKLKELVGCE